MSNIQTLNPVVSGVPGSGNKLVSFLKSGFILTAEKQQSIFDFTKGDPRAYAAFLTNMDDQGKLGNSWDFVAHAAGARLVKVGATAPTTAEIHAAKKFLSSLEFKVKVGSDDKPQAELSGLQFTDTQEFAVGTSGPVNPTSQKSEIGLPVPVLIQRGWEIKTDVKCTLPTVPTALLTAGEEWALEFFLVGFKQTY